MHDETLVSEFTHQSEAFNRAAVMSSAETLTALVDLVPDGARGRWLDAACGTGLVTRALAPRVDEVVGIDMTPAMLEVATREASAAGIANVRFELGDVTALELPTDSFDGAITRFSLHHVPVPRRFLAELARVVRPGGWVIAGDHVTDEDAEAAAWHQEVERLRDPSHWTCLTPSRIKALGRAARLQLDAERLLPFELDFDEWLARSSSDVQAAELISLCLAERPEGTPRFTVLQDSGARRMRLANFLIRWRCPS